MLTEFNWSDKDVTSSMAVTKNSPGSNDVFIDISTELSGNADFAWIVLKPLEVRRLIESLQKLIS